MPIDELAGLSSHRRQYHPIVKDVLNVEETIQAVLVDERYNSPPRLLARPRQDLPRIILSDGNGGAFGSNMTLWVLSAGGWSLMDERWSVWEMEPAQLAQLKLWTRSTGPALQNRPKRIQALIRCLATNGTKPDCTAQCNRQHYDLSVSRWHVHDCGFS